MPSLNFILAGDPSTRTGGYIYDARIVAGLRQAGWSVILHTLASRFPNPDAEDLREAGAILAGIPDAAMVVIDGLALAGMADLVRDHAGRLCLIALIHHPLALETGLAPAVRERLFGDEREALAHVARVIVTSPTTARELGAYDVAGERIGVVLPGTDAAPPAAGSGADHLALLCVATLTPRKGHAVLFRALSTLLDRNWQLTCVGSTTRSPETATALCDLLKELRLQDRIALVGEVAPEHLGPYYHDTDLFVLPSLYEGYGMVLAEAMARGLPIISTTAGAVPETVAADAALLVPPGDSAALAAALRQAIDDPSLRRRLANAARRHTLPDWPTACARFADELQGAIANG